MPASARGSFSADERVDPNGNEQDDKTVDALEPKRIHAHQDETVLYDEQCHRAQGHAKHGARSSPIATPPTTTEAMTVSSKPSATRASMVA